MFVGDSTLVLRLKAAEFFLETSQCIQLCGSAEKSGLRNVERVDLIRYWRRSGLTGPRFTVFVVSLFLSTAITFVTMNYILCELRSFLGMVGLRESSSNVSLRNVNVYCTMNNCLVL